MVYYVYAMCVCVAAHRLASDQIYARSIAPTDPWRALAAARALARELNADGTDNTGGFRKRCVRSPARCFIRGLVPHGRQERESSAARARFDRILQFAGTRMSGAV